MPAGPVLVFEGVHAWRHIQVHLSVSCCAAQLVNGKLWSMEEGIEQPSVQPSLGVVQTRAQACEATAGSAFS